MTRPWRLFWLMVLGLHAASASAWWWLRPGGFSAADPRFWSNGVAPWVVLGVVVASVVSARRSRWGMLRSALASFPIAWLSASLTLRAIFPISLARSFAIPLLGGVVMGLALFLTFRRRSLATGRPFWSVAILSAAFGVAVSLSERPGAADTHPRNDPIPPPAGAIAGRGGRHGPRTFVDADEGSVRLRSGAVTLQVRPLLNFLSRSPDGCWTILAPAGSSEGSGPRLISAETSGQGSASRYRADGEAVLRIGPDDGRGPIVLEARTNLPRRVDSHLNTFCDVEVSGHRRLALSFSPCPGTLVEVRPADYPVGRPLRLAYMDAAGGFHVVEATSGEKGPFRELARGRLGRSEPLGITFWDEGRAVARLSFDDWAAQAGTAPSPTAGWGLPVNAIEFSLTGDSPISVAAIYMTLAGTSVGRGWESVGHAPGTYRNRITAELDAGRLSAPGRPAEPPRARP